MVFNRVYRRPPLISQVGRYSVHSKDDDDATDKDFSSMMMRITVKLYRIWTPSVADLSAKYLGFWKLSISTLTMSMLSKVYKKIIDIGGK